jgi:2-dehydropantoate 2-reductase
MVVPLQNGVEAPDQLAAVLGYAPVLGGLCKIVSLVAAPGHIRHQGLEPYVAFGELDNRPSQRVERLREAFVRAQGLTVEVPPDIRSALWEKFLFIAAVSGVGAVARAPMRVLYQVPETRELLQLAMEEILAVAGAQHIALPEDIVSRTMAFVGGLPEGATASMQRDIIEGRPSELESQNGAVVRLGRQARVPTPIHSFLYQSLLPMELRARGDLTFDL